MSSNLNDRVTAACKFKDNTFYLEYHAYFDVVAQVHSVVKTKGDNWMLRVWRGHKFGPETHAQRRERRMFRVSQECFKHYIVKPDQRIGKAVQNLGKELLLEIDVYDNHREALTQLKSGDYVAIQNVHAASNKSFDMLVLHGAGEKYRRGITNVPVNYDNEIFQSLVRQVEEALLTATDYENFEEFCETRTPSLEMEPPRKQLKSSKCDSTEYQKLSVDCFAKPYNRIKIGESIYVDHFPKMSKGKYYFLTHAHTDHCKQLDTKWNRPIYCSMDTAKILPQIMGFENFPPPPDLIIPIEENTAHKFDGFHVTLINANHCPGAVMFVFEGPYIEAETGGSVLCTGDFRADKRFLEQFEPGNKLYWLTEKSFSKIYLDNTYFSLEQEFPERDTAKKILEKTIRDNSHKNIIIPLHRLGRESMLEDLSRSINEPIEVYEEKMKIANTLQYYFNFGLFNEHRRIKVVKRSGSKIDIPEQSLILNITMLPHTIRLGDLNWNQFEIVDIPYSDHSSRNEILSFLKNLRYKSVFPISKSFSSNEMRTMLQAAREFDEETVELEISQTFYTNSMRPDVALPNSNTNILKTSRLDEVDPDSKRHVWNASAQRPSNSVPADVLQTCQGTSRDPLPEGVIWQNEEWELMDGDLDNWPEGPPKDYKEAIDRGRNRMRRRNQ